MQGMCRESIKEKTSKRIENEVDTHNECVNMNIVMNFFFRFSKKQTTSHLKTMRSLILISKLNRKIIKKKYFV